MKRTKDKPVIAGFESDAKSIGALHGSARGRRNVTGRIQAMTRLTELRGNRLLDIGCGTGEYTVEMAPGFSQVDGIDIEPKRLELLQSNSPNNLTVSAMSANSLEFPDETYDIITLVEVLEHLTDPIGALVEARQVLTATGTVLLTTPNRKWPIEQHGVLVGERRIRGIFAPGLVWVKPLHRRFSDANAFSKADLRMMASEAGLHVTGVTYMMPPLDSLPNGSKVHRALDWAESSPLASFGQTIVAAMRKRPSLV